MPYVIGGKATWGKFLEENKKYPPMAKEFGAQGRVLISFIIERDGTTSHVTPVKSGDPYLEEEAARLIKNMPKWMPGVEKGACALHYAYNIPTITNLNSIFPHVRLERVTKRIATKSSRSTYKVLRVTYLISVLCI